ncbi:MULTISPECIES: zinc-finger domain-containing protein [unclassified Psychrobacillus]|uniref:zinc-finger domain-containing protein n=1 Tax=unclassified Psychrobacillus TaxID=2636677 RepID=UPI00146DBDE0|nr:MULTISPECIES: zinc-finger domain-containing protein [unclassified Psychrobacillus]MCM3359162.1 zinc-finger domain-containing protein [Psychrobacillus sp. MER TA 171]NME06417.1 zinc-finger domain-containing protein [Psychrobacillus sp. BL-248-WT-3]
MKHTQIINEIDQLIENYCEGCLVKSELRKEKGKAKAHQFCIKGCTVGEEIKEAGNKLFGK